MAYPLTIDKKNMGKKRYPTRRIYITKIMWSDETKRNALWKMEFFPLTCSDTSLNWQFFTCENSIINSGRIVLGRDRWWPNTYTMRCWHILYPIHSWRGSYITSTVHQLGRVWRLLIKSLSYVHRYSTFNRFDWALGGAPVSNTFNFYFFVSYVMEYSKI